MVNVTGVVKSQSDILIGGVAGVIAAPIVINKAGALINLGEYSTALISVGVGVAAIMFGKTKPKMAMAFASVCFANALAPMLTQFTA